MGFALIRLVSWAFEVYSWLLVARILLTWFPVDPYNPLVRWIARVTDPFLNIFRGLLPPFGMIDFSPVLAFLALRIVHSVVIQVLRQVVMWF